MPNCEEAGAESIPLKNTKLGFQYKTTETKDRSLSLGAKIQSSAMGNCVNKDQRSLPDRDSVRNVRKVYLSEVKLPNPLVQ